MFVIPIVKTYLSLEKMQRDLTLDVKKGKQHAKKVTIEKARAAAYKALIKDNRTDWPKTSIYAPFVNMPIRDMYDNLINYRLSLNPYTDLNEIKALKVITNVLPYPLVPTLIEYMRKIDSDNFREPLARFITDQKVHNAMKKSRDYLHSRIASPDYSAKQSKPTTHISAFSNTCVDNYKLARWVPAALNKDVKVIKMVSRNNKGGELVRDGWYTLPDLWYRNTCRFSRPFVKNDFGYLLEDGKILVENEKLFRASLDHSQYSGGISECIVQYLNAPWLAFYTDSNVTTMVARKTVSTKGWINEELPNVRGWYNLKMNWVERVCRNGREFIKGDIGYLLGNGKVLEETVEMFNGSKAYVARMKNDGAMTRHEYSHELMTENIPKITIGGRSSIGMVAHKTPDTVQWIVGDPIPGTTWYLLKKTWYDNVHKNGRNWQPGVFGYRFTGNDVVEETEEMFNQAAASYRSKRPIGPVHIEAAKRVLTGILPENEIDLLIENMSRYSIDDFFETVAQIAVFGSKILSIPQVHRTRLARSQYSTRALQHLTPSIMLPEIYANPARNPEKAEPGVLTWNYFNKLLAQRVKSLKESLMRGDTADVQVYEEIDVDPVANPGSDTVYYNDGEVMYAFNRRDVINKTVNPETDIDFTDDFVHKVRLIRDPVTWKAAEVVRDEYAEEIDEDVVEGEYADLNRNRDRDIPDLYSLVKKTAYKFGHVCSYCGNPMSDAKYSSVHMGEPVEFCSAECFANYRFRK